MINMGEIFAHERIGSIQMDRVPMDERESTLFSVQPGDLLFARQSLVAAGAGKCSLVKSVAELTTFESHLIRVRLDCQRVDPEFYFYYFSSPQGKANVQSLVMQVAAAGIRGSELANLEVPLPPLPIQRRIAGILSAYDDLIENSQRRIKILEEMARRLYREWFVDFRFPGYEGCTFIDSPLGEIPEGWEVLSLGDIAEEMRRNVIKGKLDEPRPYVGLEHIPRRSLALDAWDTASDLGSNKLEFKKGEVLFSKIRPYFHKVSVAPFDGLCSADAIVVRARSPEYYAFMVACISSDEFVAHATASSNGSKMPRANWGVLKARNVVTPKGKLAVKFSALVADIIAQQQALVFQIQNLRRTRDLLLPRLLSGQIDVEALPEPALTEVS
jgi:type I restriction enzyme S subunit